MGSDTWPAGVGIVYSKLNPVFNGTDLKRNSTINVIDAKMTPFIAIKTTLLAVLCVLTYLTTTPYTSW